MEQQAARGRKKLRLGDILVQQNVITEEKLQEALKKQRGSGKKLGEIMVELNMTTEEAIGQALSRQLGYKFININGLQIPEKIIKLIKSDIVKKYTAIPLGVDEKNPNVLFVAMADPMDINAIDDFAIITNMQIVPVVATPRQVRLQIDKYYASADVKNAADEYAKEREKLLGGGEDEEDYSDDINNSPIVVLVKNMIESAVRQRTSDIHIEPMENQVRIRYRIDGALYERMTYNPSLLPAITARIKIIGGMDISEKRKPQDGRITQVVDGQEFDIRVSVLPTVYGEKTVMRLTSKTGLTREKSQLGFRPDELK
ncbi:MAG: Flp pilus assembly complex ATPase component TadA, partial [Lachnospiraceae bacterium]|nr:Flp pilus assembly complex ATPase component TadA [Lachnospiraceae bacterium]